MNFVYLTPLCFVYSPQGFYTLTFFTAPQRLSMAPDRSRFRPTDGIAGYALFPTSRP